MNRVSAIVAAALIVAVMTYCAYLSGKARGRANGRNPGGTSTQGSAEEFTRQGVFALGRIEPRDGVINVSTMIGERLITLNVSEGSKVKKGHSLGELNSQKLLKANLNLAEKDLERLQSLSEDLVSAQQLERQELLVEQAKAKLQQSLIAAPTEGTVLRTFVNNGETIGSEPVLQIANLEHMVVVAEVNEEDVQYIEVGQQAVIRSRAFPKEINKEGLKGKVERIGQIIASPVIQGFNPLAKADRHVVEVRVTLAPESAEQAAKLINLEVDVTFVRQDDQRDEKS